MLNLISKIIVLNELKVIKFDDLGDITNSLNIDIFNIFSIDYGLNNETINITISNNGYHVRYIEMNSANFISWLKSKNIFTDYNKDSLYILRNSDFLDVKNIFSCIGETQVNVGRGGSQKAHVLSHLDFRLSLYLMAMFSFDIRLIYSLNTFNHISKDRYLSWTNKFKRYVFPTNSNMYNPIQIKKFPWYCKINDLCEYHLECGEVKSNTIKDFLS